jgi:hypothetical protein
MASAIVPQCCGLSKAFASVLLMELLGSVIRTLNIASNRTAQDEPNRTAYAANPFKELDTLPDRGRVF